MIKLVSFENALAKFEEAADKHANATEVGDYKTANRYYAVISKVVTFLKEKNQLIALAECLNHHSVGVRMWAAAYLLPVVEPEAIRVLEQISRDEEIHSFTAKTTISEWRKGNLKF